MRRTGVLADGTRWEAVEERRCPRCRTWVAETSIAHGPLLGALCRGRGTGPTRLDMTVARRTTRGRVDPTYLVAPTEAQRAEILGLLAIIAGGKT